MMAILYRIIRCVAAATVVLLPAPALATQGHGGIEGVYVHQFGHIFFIVAMGILIFWLRERRLTEKSGWRYIQYTAFFFILWNLDAALVHFLDDQTHLIRVTRIDSWHIDITAESGPPWLAVVYYCAKLDHLLCVPALWCLYTGLKRLLAETAAGGEGGS